MVTTDDMNVLVEKLERNADFVASGVSTPSVGLIPYKRSPRDLYLSIKFAVPAQCATLPILWSLWKAVFQEIQFLPNILPNVKGVSIFIGAITELETVRLLRVTVETRAYDHPVADLPTDLLTSSPRDGITCSWYTDPGSLIMQ
jgi:hypothetical protein